MKKLLYLLLTITTPAWAQVYKATEPLAHTFSIIARDPATGQMAAAVQSHWFSVGTSVIWGKSGVGVVATQSFTNKSYGAFGLQLMQNGVVPQQALNQLLAKDAGREVRQVAFLNTKGQSAVYTGKQCIAYATDRHGANYSVQSNMMLTDKVCAAMEQAFLKSTGQPLAERVVASLKAAQAAGGDIRGRQSAALIVVSGTPVKESWNDKLIDLRVDDNPNPIVELDRLLKLQRAYEHMNNGDLNVEKHNMPKAMAEYTAAERMFPANLEMQYWHAITLANNHRAREASVMLKHIYAKDANWRELTRRLPKVGQLTVTPAELQLLLQ
ncbi:DUF1028 domain-containing protein [Mucilaginibacter robiniae]|uniref:DUF1028 domain-containing protein n=1 Tax=Mucilaginibacter robiniae TaxID=2728022 RepID=A0A7L5E485_9SPHI|nr:DUF1028 domain-containing protein [Mucilaginibacter robiniae]QJD97099.1 DUF1028 domain-containing protein [Mucilaginibacter robiniae]